MDYDNQHVCSVLAGSSTVKSSRKPAFGQSFIPFTVFILLVSLNTSCSLCKKRKSWSPPQLAPSCNPYSGIRNFWNVWQPKHPGGRVHPNTGFSRLAVGWAQNPERALELAEHAYSEALVADKSGHERCVDAYYEAVVYSWIYVSGCRLVTKADAITARAWDVYHSSLAGLIAAGQKSGRFNPQQGILIRTPHGPHVVPVSFHGFVWQRNDFQQLELVGQYQDRNLGHQYRSCGLGVPLVALRQQLPVPHSFDSFYLQQTPFAATAVLCPDVNQWLGQGTPRPINGCCTHGTLALYDPLRIKRIQCNGVDFQLAADITAPLGYLGRENNWNPLEEFARPETDPSLAGLRMLEPYQPGKIPIVFVHGLFSDPQTYLAMANRIRACADLDANYQIWVFRYPTGATFLQSAASLRTHLRALVALCGSCDQDPALEQIVMVGHSLGGLIVKLQVTESGTTLWDSIARCPLDQIVASDQERAKLAREFFFAADPSIKSVIFIATPQDGAPYASRPMGKLASQMVKYSSHLSASHQQLISDNPGVFAPVMQRRIPTSIDLMKPNNPLLLGMQRLRVNPCVKMHSIIGTGGCRLSTLGESDGIVPVYSAQNPGVQSEFYVDSIHTDILRNDMTLAEVERILRAHACQVRTATMAGT